MLTRTSTTLLKSLLREPADQRAWQELCARFGPAVFRFARRRGLGEAEADEVLSETLQVLFEAYRARRYQRAKGRLRTWVFGIANNKVHEMRRKLRKDHQVSSLDDLVQDPAAQPAGETAPPPDPYFDADVDRSLAWQCLDAVRKRVAPLTYQAFDLYVIKGRTPQDVAKILGIDKDAVYVAKSRVISSARREYEKITSERREV